MSRAAFVLLSLLLAGSLVPATLGAQDLPATLLITAVNAEGTEVVEGVNVTIPGLGLGTLTNAVGQARIAQIPPGTHEVEATLIGYRTQRVTIDFDPGEVERLDLRMEVAAVALEGVEATAERRVTKLADVGFYDREEMGFGDFLDREDILRRAAGTGRMSSVFRGIPGIRVMPLPGTTGYYLEGTRAGQRCLPQIIMDGGRIAQMGPEDIDRLLQANHIEAVEIYSGPSDTPMQFRYPGQTCGTIVVWTRSGP